MGFDGIWAPLRRLRNRVYYTVRPALPRPLQLALRRRWALLVRRRNRHWPVDPQAARPPAGWRGWPGGKRFALVLSHDVDTLEGYRRVRRLAALEARLGFRSNFNFVPERYGPVSTALLAELKGAGFGVGVHGLKHDGKLFFSKSIFMRRAAAINHYLRQWEARGFTAPSMHHRPKWLHALEIDYSISTFDTDPFEPQPDGVRTIFPLWMPNGDGGYVELPYTLPQDSTLFVILQEKDIGIWKRKLDWIVENGGMALLNTHPDYMGFGRRDEGRSDLYPVGHYTELLEYVKSKYADTCYHALPAEIAEICRAQLGPANPGRNSGRPPRAAAAG